MAAARSKSKDTKSPARAKKAAKSPKPPKSPKSEKKVAKRTPSRSRSTSRGRTVKKPTTTTTTTTPKSAQAPKPTRSRSSSRARIAPTPQVKSVAPTPVSVRSRSSERRKPQATSTPIRTLRSDSHSPSKSPAKSPAKVKLTKSSACPLYPNLVCDAGKKACTFVKDNSKDLFISFLIVGLLSVLTHLILFYDPAHIRDHLQNIPAKIQTFAKTVYSSIRK